MARPGSIGNDRIGPVAEMANAGAVQRPFSWFKSRPGLQPWLLRSFGSATQWWRRLPRRSSQERRRALSNELRVAQPRGTGGAAQTHPQNRS